MEYFRRCNTCGHFWCYTDYDLKQNKTNNAMSAISAIGQIAAGLSGNMFQMTAATINSDSLKKNNPVIDYHKCPQCNSQNTEILSADEWAKLKEQKERNAAGVTRTIQINSNATPENLIARAYDFLEDADWDSAGAYADACLDLQPQNGEAYLIKLLVDLQVPTKDKLFEYHTPFDQKPAYAKILRYGDETLKSELTTCIQVIQDRNRIAAHKKAYGEAMQAMNAATTPEAFLAASQQFASIAEYKDANLRARQCNQQAEECRQDIIYAAAAQQMLYDDIASCESALAQWHSIPNWRDAKEQAQICEQKIAALKRKKKKTKTILLSLLALLAALAVLVVCLLPNIKYAMADSAANRGDFVTAYDLFVKSEHKDSAEQAANIKAKALAQTISRASVGDIVTYGRYNGKDIRWVVIETENGVCTLLSKEILDGKPYHNKKAATTWAGCSLRKWLNGTFLNTAFTADEIAYIANTKLTQESSPRYGTSGGKDTTDKVYLLSMSEARNLRGAILSVDDMYWLRSPVTYRRFTWGKTPSYHWYGAVVSHDGEIMEGVAGGDMGYYGVAGDTGVRPVIRVAYQ